MQTPSNLGRYRILQEVGRGAMGRVFLAHDPEIDRQVAIKTIQDFLALPANEQDEARERFLREARSAGKLLHPGIVTLFDVGLDGGQFYLAMEYVQGTTLDHYCSRKGLLPIRTAVELVADVAEALDYAHKQQVVHRDIKPANLMRVGETEVKIMDFGLARAAQAQLTQDGALLGTPSYMAPEQIRGESLDGRSDLFSLGVVLFELLTGEKPFPGDSISSIIFRIVNDEARGAAAVHGRVPPSMDRFLARALAKDREQRFADGTTFAAELRRAATELPAEDTAPVPAQAKGPAAGEHELPPALETARRRSSARPFVLAALLLVVAGAAAAYHFREELGITLPGQPREVWWEAAVRTEPPGLPVTLDGEPLDPAAGGLVRYAGAPPFGVLRAGSGCRVAEHQLGPTDAGAEVVLLIDSAALAWSLDPGVEGAAVSLNGEPLGQAPLDLKLDLCEDNAIEIEAAGYRPAQLELPAEATPLEARTRLAGLVLERVPVGRVLLPETPVKVVVYVDGERLPADTRELELTEGTHTLRAKNEGYWIDVTRKFEVVGGEETTPALDLPALTTIVVQAFPANCKVFLRRPGGSWRFLDDTPVRSRVSIGPYEVRVKLNPTGETNDQRVDLGPGENPPIRVAFGGRS